MAGASYAPQALAGERGQPSGIARTATLPAYGLVFPDCLRNRQRPARKEKPPGVAAGRLVTFPKSSGRGSRRQNRPPLRQHFLNGLTEPQGQRSLRPTFSSSCLSPWTIRSPRLTFVSEGKPRRRLLIVSKKRPGFQVLRVHEAPSFPEKPVGELPDRDAARGEKVRASGGLIALPKRRSVRYPEISSRT